MCDALLRDAIEAVRLEPSPTSHYRSRMVYGVLTRAAIAADNLGMSNVKRVAAAVAEWVEEHSAMPRGFWRELTVRASRSGALQLKLILQVSGDAGACTLAFDPIWTAELTAFESFVRAAVDGRSEAHEGLETPTWECCRVAAPRSPSLPSPSSVPARPSRRRRRARSALPRRRRRSLRRRRDRSRGPPGSWSR